MIRGGLKGWLSGERAARLAMFSDFEEQCRYGADRIRDAARKVPEGGRFSLALSGGSSPGRLYELLAGRDLPWDRVLIYWADERMVPLDSPRSNYALVRERLLDHVPVPEANIHPVAVGLAGSAEAATKYEQQLLRLRRSARGLPRFDLVLLGMGEDGHTASLFPGSRALAETERWAAGVAAEESPDGLARVSLTLPVINSADRVLVHLRGEAKTALVQELVDEGGHSDLPISRVRPEGSMEWLLSPPLASLAPGSADQTG
jgi:6-phosphogluconolactonase